MASTPPALLPELGLDKTPRLARLSGMACRAWNDLRRLVQVSTMQDINFGESIVFYAGWVWGPLAREHLS